MHTVTTFAIPLLSITLLIGCSNSADQSLLDDNASLKQENESLKQELDTANNTRDASTFTSSILFQPHFAAPRRVTSSEPFTVTVTPPSPGSKLTVSISGRGIACSVTSESGLELGTTVTHQSSDLTVNSTVEPTETSFSFVPGTATPLTLTIQPNTADWMKGTKPREDFAEKEKVNGNLPKWVDDGETLRNRLTEPLPYNGAAIHSLAVSSAASDRTSEHITSD